MKKILLKNLFFLIFITILINPAFTQIESDITETFEETPYSEWFLSLMEDTCDYPVLLLSPVIHYASGPQAYVEFSDFVVSIRFREQGTLTFSTLEINDNKKLLSNLLSDKIYEVYTLSRCGEYELAGVINTQTGERDIIEVSSSLYEAITDFQTNETNSISFTGLMSGGKRSWHSWARVLSDFYVAGYVPGGFSHPNARDCCTPKIGNWVLATVPRAPFTMNELLAQVGNIFTAWAPWPYPRDPGTNILQLPAYEYHLIL